MGLLTVGTPLEWNEAKPHIKHVKTHGVIQFLNIYNKVKTRRLDHLLWGEEVEYCVVKLNTIDKTATLSLKAEETLQKLEQLEHNSIKNGKQFESSWKPEYARYMLEGTPGYPYGATLNDLLLVEDNMHKRRVLCTSLLGPGEVVLTLSNFFLLGTPQCFYPNYPPTPDKGSSRSLFIPEEAITRHARFPTLTKNIRERRQEKVAINLPIFRDTNTPNPFREPVPPSVIELLKSRNEPIPASLPDYEPAAKENHVYMDAMCFGMGCSCLQVTIQGCTIEATRRLYDHMTVMTPIMLALSATAPIFKGYLTDVDCRWDVISGSVDDRSKEERGVLPLKDFPFRIPKSRYESVSRYLSPGPNVSGLCSGPDFEKVAPGQRFYKEEYNDLPEVLNNEVYEQLIAGGVDDNLARHYAYLFIRDPLVIFKELLDIDDCTSSDHFENIQSTNWQTMRFKPPTPNSNIGWRVEFRSMDIQLTDHENAAYSNFINLLARAILKKDLNFYIPLSKVDENMHRSQKRNAVLGEKFWFRKNINPEGADLFDTIEEEYEQMTVKEIMNGKGMMPGICTVIDEYLDMEEIAESTRNVLKAHVNLVRQRSTGERKTGATWIREFVMNHPLYKHDSIVSREINYDLCQRIFGLDSSELLIHNI